MNPINKVLQNFKQLSCFLINNEKHFLINFAMHNSKIFIIQSKTSCNSLTLDKISILLQVCSMFNHEIII
jgi:hypothetical protein